ncbi:MAG TPA: DNA polymerase Y family protein [Candidatus Lumbricidophila sp.]|nr:DNA polymerase Y family protein [Candidatus Lumbricidophila sp.]
MEHPPQHSRSIVLWCPDWPVVALCRESGWGFDEAIVLTEAGAVHSCSPAARRDGVRRGLRVREAQLRAPGARVAKYDQVRDMRAFEPVVRQIEQAVPGLQVIRPGTVAMRARGPVRYYGSEVAAARALLDTVAASDVPGACVGIADGPFAAEQAARVARVTDQVRLVEPGASAAFLAPFPVSLVVDARRATLLMRLGIRTLGEFAALGADDVRRRFGASGVFAHARATGNELSTVLGRTPPPEYEVTQAFEPPLDRIDQLAFALRVKADEFIDRMRKARLVCTAIHVEIVDDRGGQSNRSWLHPRWFTSADVIDRVRWQLQGSGGADQRLGAPIAQVRVMPERVDSTGNHEAGLWGGGPEERVHHVLTKVQSILGHEGVLTAAVGGGRMLAERQILVPWGDRAPKVTAAPWPGSLPLLAPASVFPVPVPVQVSDASGAPVAIDDRGAIVEPPATFAVPAAATALGVAPQAPRKVQAWAGPWPVVDRWWDATRARRIHRFQLIDGDGCAWLLVRSADGWWAEARYD